MKKAIVSIIACISLLLLTGEATTIWGQLLSFAINGAIFAACALYLNREDEDATTENKQK